MQSNADPYMFRKLVSAESGAVTINGGRRNILLSSKTNNDERLAVSCVR